jgi:hypothetical protein
MSLASLTFRTVVCNDCSKESPEAALASYSDFAPPPSDWSYDGRCPFCGSKNTTITGPYDDDGLSNKGPGKQNS